MQGFGAEKIPSMGWTANELIDYISSLSQDMLITVGCEISLKGSSSETGLLYNLYEFSFCWKTVTALLCLPKYRFLPGNH